MTTSFFVDELPSYSKDETTQRDSKAYLKFDEAYRTTVRVLDHKARQVFKHFIEAANAGRGTSVVCPNIGAQTRVCPIEAETEGLPRENQERRNSFARRRYVTNVLDRTPYTTCESCGTFTPGQKCSNCGNSLKGHDFKALNKVKIMEGGPRLFVDSLLAIDRMQQEDGLGDITQYDITFTTSGKGRDKKISALPRDPSPLDPADLLDENGEPQKVYDLDDLSEPTPIEEIKMWLAGATLEEVNNWRKENNL